jgi:hypothetical protein
MLGLGTSLITSSPIAAPFDVTYTFTSASDVSAWGIGNAARIDSINYQASVSLGGQTYTNLMKVTMVANGPGGSGFIRLSDAFTDVADGTTVKVEVDYGVGKNNDETLRIASFSVGGNFKVIHGTNQSANAFYSVAPTGTVNVGTSNNDLAVYIPADTALTGADVIFIQRIRVYEP